MIVALTIAYGVSGLAVNHIEDWNPSFAERKEHLVIAPVADGPLEAMVADARRKLALADAPKSTFSPGRETLQLFYEHRTYTIDRPTGNVIAEAVIPRPVLREMNDLHLNALKGWWTYVADAYAVSLILMAISGMLMLRGRVGLAGRGKWLVGAGALLPLGFIVWHKWVA